MNPPGIEKEESSSEEVGPKFWGKQLPNNILTDLWIPLGRKSLDENGLVLEML